MSFKKLNFKEVLLILIAIIASLPFVSYFLYIISGSGNNNPSILPLSYFSGYAVNFFANPILILPGVVFLLIAILNTINLKLKKSDVNLKRLKNLSVVFAFIAVFPAIFYLVLFLLSLIFHHIFSNIRDNLSDLLIFICFVGGFIVTPVSILISIYFGVITFLFSRKFKIKLNRILIGLLITVLLGGAAFWVWLVYHLT